MIAIKFISCFISLLEGHIKPSVKLGTAQRKRKLREQQKNDEIISRNSLPHNKRTSSFMNKHKAAQLHLLPKLSRYRRMSESVQHEEQFSSLHDRWCLRYDEQCSSLHAEGLRINPSAWGHLNSSSYCDVGRLFYGVFKLWSKLQKKKWRNNF